MPPVGRWPRWEADRLDEPLAGATVEMLVGSSRRPAAARGALEEPDLDKIGFVDLLERLAVLPDRRRERRQSDRSAAELFEDRGQDAAVDLVEAVAVHLEPLERVDGRSPSDGADLGDLREIPDPSQQAIDDARRASRAPRDLLRALRRELDAEDLGRSCDDDPEVLDRVVVQVMD